MRSKLFVLASLAACALALPTDLSLDRRAVNVSAGLHVDLTPFLGGALDLNLFVGLGAEGAAALQGCAMGVKPSQIDSSARQQLKNWLNSAAAVHIDASLKASVLNWCNGDDSAVLSTDLLADLGVYIPAVAQIAAKGGLTVSLDGIVKGVEAAVSAVLDVNARASLSAFLKTAVDLDAKVKAGLHVAAAGGLAVSLGADVKAALEAYLNAAASLDANLKAALQAWLKGTIGGSVVAAGDNSDDALATVSVGSAIAARVDANGVLNAAAQASLSAFLESDAAAKLDAGIKAALELAAKGGVAASLSADAHVALSLWLASAECSLTAELKGLLTFWLSVGIAVHDTVTLAADEVAKITAFLSGTVDATLSAAVRGALAVAAAGSSVADLALHTIAEVAGFLGGVGVNIDADVKAILTHWLTGCTCSNKSARSVNLPDISAVPKVNGLPVSVPGPRVPVVSRF
ncbi:hypothetical protein M432DRAFT_347116 [Thermoascus aurantiacus ATCC 26904]